jgi:hypothetical protein
MFSRPLPIAMGGERELGRMTASNRLVCPRCGWAASHAGKHSARFMLVQFTVREHRVIGLGVSGTLKVEAKIDREDTGGALPQLRCGDCAHDFDLPPGLRVKFL